MRTFEPAKRLKQIKPTETRRFFAPSQEIHTKINLSVGEPDFTPPPAVLDAYSEAVTERKTHYPPTNGVPELREALSQKAYRDYGLDYDPNSEVLITAGASEAIFISLFGFVNPGDEVLIPNPGFVGYEPAVLLAGGVPVSVGLLEENEFKPSIRDVTSRVTKKSRVMILNYPSNPTGAVLSYDEARALAEFAVERDMIVISDEVYEKIVYDGVKHYCLASFPGMRERTLVINFFSKTYAMTGLRVGFVYGPEELVSVLWLVHQYSITCVNSLAQYAALAAIRGQQDVVTSMVNEFARRRHLICDGLNEIKGFHCSLPKGAFYAFQNVKDRHASSEELCESLIKNAGVMTVPGSAFGSNVRVICGFPMPHRNNS